MCLHKVLQKRGAHKGDTSNQVTAHEVVVGQGHMCAQGDWCVVQMKAYSAVIPTPGQGGGEVHFHGLPALPVEGLSHGKCPI